MYASADLSFVSSTISARRRHILHIAANGWELGGGHFERCVKFGYDADLTRVSAELDGDRLDVSVPKRDWIQVQREGGGWRDWGRE
jgi:hypothetical protein